MQGSLPHKRIIRKIIKIFEELKPIRKKSLVIENNFTFNPEILRIKNKKNVFISGNWQSEKYFNDIKNIQTLIQIGKTIDKIKIVIANNPLKFDFIVDSGNDSADQSTVKEQSEKIVRYFLAALTVPVNT